MNKLFLSALLMGAMVLPTVTLTSCDDDDKDLKNRVTILEGLYSEIKPQLDKALKTGLSVTNVAQDEKGVYTITLSDASQLVIPTKGGGGSDISVTVTDSQAIITVDGTDFILPLGGTVSSLTWVPTYDDMQENLGSSPIEVSFMARPAITDLSGAEITIALANKLQSRGGDGEEFTVIDSRIDGDLLKVKIRGLQAEPSTSYAVAIQMNYKGTMIGSNFFKLFVQDDFQAVADDLSGYTLNTSIDGITVGTKRGDGTEELNVSGDALMNLSSLANLFTQVPEGSTYRVAPVSKQDAGDAQSKRDKFASMVAADGTVTLKYLGTTYTNHPNDADGNPVADWNPGIKIEVVKDAQVRARVALVFNDPFADVDWKGGWDQSGWEIEYGGRNTDYLAQIGGWTWSYPEAMEELIKTAEDFSADGTGENNEMMPYPMRWSNPGYRKYEDLEVVNGGETILAYDGHGWAKVTDYGKKYLTDDCAGFFVYLGGYNSQRTDEVGLGWEDNDTGKDMIGGDTWDSWWGNGHAEDAASMTPAAFAQKWCSEGGGDKILPFCLEVEIGTGKVTFPAAYAGQDLRLAFNICFQYIFGTKQVGSNGMFYFNRRRCPEGSEFKGAQPK